MESSSQSSISNPLVAAVGYLSNGSAQRYLLEVESTTSFVAWRLDDGTTLVNNAAEVSLPPSSCLRFWACAGYQDTTPAGQITSVDCHGNAITHLDVLALAGLEFLDCSFNKLEQLVVTGLTDLQGLDADNNRLVTLNVSNLPNLRVLNCAHNRLTGLDLTDLKRLEILDASHNQLTQLILPPEAPLRDVQAGHNPVSLHLHLARRN